MTDVPVTFDPLWGPDAGAQGAFEFDHDSAPTVRYGQRQTPRWHWPLRRILDASDAAVIAGVWLSVSLLLNRWHLQSVQIQLGRLVIVTATGMTLVLLDRLDRTRMAPFRSVELVRLTRVAIGTAVAAYVVGLVSRGQRREVVIGAVSCYVLLALSRRFFAAGLSFLRKRGRCLDGVVVVGNDSDAGSFAAVLQRHPEFGYYVCGLVADELPVGASTEIPLLGPPANTLEIVKRVRATGAILSTGGLSPTVRNSLLRDLVAADVYVQLTTGLSGISYRRLRPMPIGHHSCLGVEPIALGRAQMVAKRMLDIVMAPLTLLATGPVLVIAALLVKIQDGGPILFRQRRVGRDGKPFTLYKFRTMTVDAEQRLAGLAAHNERDGPLFKVTDDPRVTKIGRVLRATSIDELPQLVNVFLGTMTLVGPRPALPDEVEQFDDELLGRHRMTPGLTGMWQVEARDDPSFESYRLYDMFYIENWSLSLDLAIIFGTVTSMIARTFRHLTIGLLRHGESPVDEATIEADGTGVLTRIAPSPALRAATEMTPAVSLSSTS